MIGQYPQIFLDISLAATDAAVDLLRAVIW